MAVNFDASVNFHQHKNFRIAEAIPGIATASALVRLIDAVCSLTANIFKFLFGKPAERVEVQEENDDRAYLDAMYSYKRDCCAAIGYNLMMIGDSLITAIPIVGNIQSWHWTYMERKRNQYEQVS